MKIIGKILLTAFLLFFLFVILCYFLFQTTWASGWISKWMSENRPYKISIKKIEHFWKQPEQLILTQVTLSDAKNSISADKATLSFSSDWRRWFEKKPLDGLMLHNGTVWLSDFLIFPPGFFSTELLRALPLKTKMLKLNNMALKIDGEGCKIDGKNLSGGFIPLNTAFNKESGFIDKAFQFSLGSLKINDILAHHLFIQGEMTENSLKLNNFGANVAQGELTGSAVKKKDNDWQIDELRLSHIRLQTKKTLKAFLETFLPFSPVRLNYLELTNHSLEGTGWAFNDLNLILEKVRFYDGTWHSDDGQLTLNATDMISGDLHFKDPAMLLHFSNQGVNIEQFSTYWKEGILKGKGIWNRADRRLALEELSIDYLIYRLPSDWRALWNPPLPEWLSEIHIQKLTANRNLLIDTSPEFPFQITSLGGFGDDLQLAKHHQWGMYSGELNLNAQDATFNKNDMRHLSVKIQAQPEEIKINDLSGLTQNGILQANGSLGQTPERPFSLALTGRSVDVNILQNWGWRALPFSGTGDLQLTIEGSLGTGTDFKNTLTGSLEVTKDDKEKIHQTIKEGEISTSGSHETPAKIGS